MIAVSPAIKPVKYLSPPTLIPPGSRLLLSERAQRARRASQGSRYRREETADPSADILKAERSDNLAVAKHKGRRRRSGGRLIVRKFEKNLTLSTLAGDTVLKGDIFDDALNSDEYFISADVYMMKTGGTVGEGPLQVGVAHNDYTVGEILEALINDAGANSNDLIPQEQGRRRVRTWGFFPGITAAEVLNNGIKSRQKIKFPIGDTGNLAMFVMNNSGAQLTTGVKIRVWGTSYSKKNG